MPRTTRFPMAAALSCTMSTPLLAQDADDDLAAMRAQLAAMNARIDQLETALERQRVPPRPDRSPMRPPPGR